MKWYFILIFVLLVLFLVYFAYVFVAVFLINKKVMGVRGKDPDNPCFLQFDDYEDHLKRTPYQTGYYGKAINGYLYQDKRFTSFQGFIILAHGFFGTHLQYLADIAFLTEHGYQVLAFDQYGVGLSEGDSQVSLASGIYCLENIIHDVEKRRLNGSLPLILYGHSWGAYSCAGALKKHPEIAAAILRSGPVNPTRAMKDLIKKTNQHFYFSIAPFFSFATFLLLGKRNMISSTRGLKKNKTTPCLFLHAKNDPMVPLSNSLAEYYLKHPQKNAFVSIREDGKHNTLLLEEATEIYHKAVKQYEKFIQGAKDENEKTRREEEFSSSLHRVDMYPYCEEVCSEILRFLKEKV